MNVFINSVHFKADRKLSTFIKDKMSKLNTFYDGVIGAEVKLKLDNSDKPENKIVEVRLMIRGNDLFSEKTAKSFEEATDQAADALKKQLIRHKSKVRGT